MRGPADITAADIEANSDVEILNPDLNIATLNKSGRLAIDITVERAAATCPPTATSRARPSA